MIEQGVIATAAFDALNRTLDNIVKLLYFSDCKLSLCKEIAKEQLQTNYNFIYLCDRGLRPPKHKVFSAHRVFRHAGMDITKVLPARSLIRHYLRTLYGDGDGN